MIKRRATTTGGRRTMKLTTQLTVLICVCVLGIVALAASLAIWADWSDGAVVGMVSAFGTVATGLIIAVRNQGRTNEQLEQITHQTNGLSQRERQDIAARAAREAIAAHNRGELR